MFRMELGLDRIKNVLNAMGMEKPPFEIIHIVGTNGKGSTAAFAEAVGRENGLKIGLFTSPHFLDFRERALVDCQSPEESEWLAAANRVMSAGGSDLTYFEFMTACAIALFADKRVDWAVMEAGLGGTYDATRALPARVVLVTKIGLDHTRVLGESISEIAADKAGAIRTGTPVVSLVQDKLVEAELVRAAARVGAELSFVSGEDLPEDFTPGLGGDFQKENAALALAGWQAAEAAKTVSLESAQVKAGIKNTWLPGRFQQIAGKPEFILDCGHNPSALKSFAEILNIRNIEPETVIFTCLSDKDLPAMARIVRQMGAGRLIVPELPGVERARKAAEVAMELGPGAKAAKDLASALEELPKEGVCIICGSLFLLAEFFRLRPDCLKRRI